MLKILVVNHTLPNVRGFTTVLFKNLVPILKQKTDVNITWVIHSSENFSNYTIQQNEKIVKMNEYDNALDILKKEKPDIVYIIPGINVPDYAFSLAAKFLNIYRIGSELGNVLFTKKSNIGIISQISGENDSQTCQISKFIQKHKFLINTQRKIGWNYFKIIQDLISIFFMYFPIKGSRPDFSPKFQLEQHFVESEMTVNTLTDLGFERSKITITGNPSYDKLFGDINRTKIQKTNKKNKILILTTTIFGDSREKTIEKRNLFITEVLKNLKSNENEISIKIHPTHEKIEEYRKITDSIDSNIPIYQKEELGELISKSDIIITPVSSTSVVSGLIQRKAIIIWNVFGVQNDTLLKNKLACECKNPNKLQNLVNEVKNTEISEVEIDNFITKYLFKADGKATQRIANAILDINK